MKSDLAIAALIQSRMTEFGLSRGELVKRLGYKNLAKGIRRIDALREGHIVGTKQLLDVLPQALETSTETVKLALLAERTVPSPIFVAAMIGVEKLLRIDLDATQGPVSFVRQVLDRLPEEVPAFGKSAGFVINYFPDKAVRFDPNGRPIAILDKAVRPGTAVLIRLGGRPIPYRSVEAAFR